MKFTHDGREYTIEFQREYKMIPVYDDDINAECRQKSQYPYTTARLMEVDPAKPLASTMFREATVGCWSKEPVFSLEKGRVRALRMITRTIPKEMKPKMWLAYHNRVPKPVKIPTSMVKD